MSDFSSWGIKYVEYIVFIRKVSCCFFVYVCMHMWMFPRTCLLRGTYACLCVEAIRWHQVPSSITVFWGQTFFLNKELIFSQLTWKPVRPGHAPVCVLGLKALATYPAACVLWGRDPGLHACIAGLLNSWGLSSPCVFLVIGLILILEHWSKHFLCNGSHGSGFHLCWQLGGFDRDVFD